MKELESVLLKTVDLQNTECIINYANRICVGYIIEIEQIDYLNNVSIFDTVNNKYIYCSGYLEFYKSILLISAIIFSYQKTNSIDFFLNNLSEFLKDINQLKEVLNEN